MMNARWPRPALRSRRGRLTSRSRPSLYIVNASPTTLTRPIRSSSSRKTAGSTPYTSTSQSFAMRPIRRSRTHPPTNSARPPSPRTARASLRIFSGTGEGISKKDSEGRRRPARLNGVAVAEINVVFVGVVFVSVLVRLVRISVEVVNENLYAARRGQTTDDLHALDARALRRRVPQLYPEAARVAVYDEGRAVQHHRHRLGHRAVAQLFEKFRHVLPELLELQHDRALFNFGGRQLDRLVRFEQQTPPGLLVSLFDDRHKKKP